jgi:hypothetical protein
MVANDTKLRLIETKNHDIIIGMDTKLKLIKTEKSSRASLHGHKAQIN